MSKITLLFFLLSGFCSFSQEIVSVLNSREQNENISFNPHIMFISKKKIINKWFTALFKWLFKCEKIFGFSELKGYDQERLYAYLAERYLSYWFNKYSKPLKCSGNGRESVLAF